MSEQREFDKNLDLHESEWAEEGKRAPFWGPCAFWFFRVTVPTLIGTLIFGYVLKTIVYGLFG